MKTVKFIPFLAVLLLVALSSQVYAQDQHDVITKLSGERIEGKVTGVSTDVVKFHYAGEDLEYELKKENISKIEFANGQTQVFNEQLSDQPAAIEKESMAATPPAEDRTNKLAVLPFQFVTNDQGIMVGAMQNRTQTTCANYFREESGVINVQNPMQTNALLSKNNIDADAVMAMNPKELATMLGVEYVVVGSVDVVNKGTTSYGSSSTSYKDKESKNREDNKSKKENKGYEFSSGSSTTTVNYDTTVDLAIISDQGETIYSDSRHAIGTDMEAFDRSIHYMVKRTPFGTKYKGRK